MNDRDFHHIDAESRSGDKKKQDPVQLNTTECQLAV